MKFSARVVIASRGFCLPARISCSENTPPESPTLMIIVIATVQCKAGKRDSFLAEFQQIVPQVLEETGCIEYGPTVDATTDLANQDRNADRVTIVEKWESLATLQAHLVAPHMHAYRPKVKDFVASSELRVLENA